MNQRIRVPIGIAANEAGTAVVCEDGAVFLMAFDPDTARWGWQQMEPIPGTLADRAAQPVGCSDPRD